MSKLLVCVDMSEEGMKAAKQVKGHPLFSLFEEIHYVHCFEMQTYSASFVPYTYPNAEQMGTIQKEGEQILKDLAAEITPKKNNLTSVIFSHSPKQKIKEYIEDHHLKACVVMTNEKHGLSGIFHNSFASFLTSHVHADVHVLRPRS